MKEHSMKMAKKLALIDALLVANAPYQEEESMKDSSAIHQDECPDCGANFELGKHVAGCRDWVKAGFASPAHYRDAQMGLDVVAVFMAGAGLASVICLGCWFFGVL